MDNFVRMIENIPAAMDQILHESKSDSSSSDSSSDDDNKKKRKTKTFKRIKAHPVSEASHSSENEDQKVQKKPKTQNINPRNDEISHTHQPGTVNLDEVKHPE